MYDSSKDVVIFNAGTINLGELRYRVVVRSYDGGENKITAEQVVSNKNGDMYIITMKRIPANIMKYLLPLFDRAARYNQSKAA
jgi:hypothetical protein